MNILTEIANVIGCSDIARQLAPWCLCALCGGLVGRQAPHCERCRDRLQSAAFARLVREHFDMVTEPYHRCSPEQYAARTGPLASEYRLLVEHRALSNFGYGLILHGWQLRQIGKRLRDAWDILYDNNGTMVGVVE